VITLRWRRNDDGAGWLVVMDDWLGRGGPAGAMLAFGIGGILLLPVGWVYGKWVERLPDASGEAAYTAQVFPPSSAMRTGWIMLLAYFIVCPWESGGNWKIGPRICIPGWTATNCIASEGTRFFCRGSRWNWHDGVPGISELQRNSRERVVSEMDYDRRVASVLRYRGDERRARVVHEFSAGVSRGAASLRTADPADCSVFHDRI